MLRLTLNCQRKTKEAGNEVGRENFHSAGKKAPGLWEGCYYLPGVCFSFFFASCPEPGCSPSPTRQLVCIIQGLMAGSLRGDSRRAGARAGFWVRADHKCKLVRN